jgi:mannose-6-phosphate isomerase-like protein (cupin superfamily)
VLFDASDGRNYMARQPPRSGGQAEIHTKDADVIYVMQGKATFVTGGEAVDAKTTAPDELRGSGISDGKTQQIAKGDVIIVPHGVPHQFLEVTDPFLYYVVTVREARDEYEYTTAYAECFANSGMGTVVGVGQGGRADDPRPSRRSTGRSDRPGFPRRSATGEWPVALPRREDRGR